MVGPEEVIERAIHSLNGSIMAGSMHALEEQSPETGLEKSKVMGCKCTVPMSSIIINYTYIYLYKRCIRPTVLSILCMQL